MGTMAFAPDRVEVKRGETIRFVIKNIGALKHEFMLASVKENAAHGKLMEKFPDMEHDDPNGKTMEPGKVGGGAVEIHRAGAFSTLA